MEEENEPLRGLFCASALIADCISRINLLKVILQSSWESAKGFLDGGMAKVVPENQKKLVDSTIFFQAEGDATGHGASPDSSVGFGLARVRIQPQSQCHCTQPPKDPRGNSCGIDFRNEQMGTAVAWKR
ncbi:uncharacterized protein MONOS_2565 [Monocercomonoides exilis]|uniref:uncharacterized protein n=1 Tax=Monocercomonoides exilis TaxID=2049356 RepID=UPI00355A09E4|nr:hypothetical protein MONOS_2565 [Monocercomonoides exilis]|eukprot:MONOS_2565.1-p1 / transcript=MONOS_2565.1 / gene=MONOS_2565 / organism=Monocercomonoides_exilis_PA203 / gene_product=unspecified product / transcript_product=unspecified product / location=Mono_scaffold00053:151463-152004(+) / protein_length=129 / sequence_SO=supercontig / SO=protein_coding / is_pseudo=false